RKPGWSQREAAALDVLLRRPFLTLDFDVQLARVPVEADCDEQVVERSPRLELRPEPPQVLAQRTTQRFLERHVGTFEMQFQMRPIGAFGIPTAARDEKRTIVASGQAREAPPTVLDRDRSLDPIDRIRELFVPHRAVTQMDFEALFEFLLIGMPAFESAEQLNHAARLKRANEPLGLLAQRANQGLIERDRAIRFDFGPPGRSVRQVGRFTP